MLNNQRVWPISRWRLHLWLVFFHPGDGLEMVELNGLKPPVPQDWWVICLSNVLHRFIVLRAWGKQLIHYHLVGYWFDLIVYEYIDSICTWFIILSHVPRSYNSATCQAFIPRIGWRYLGGNTCKSIHPVDFAHFCPKWIPLFSSQQLEHPAAVPDVPGAPADEDPRLLTPRRIRCLYSSRDFTTNRLWPTVFQGGLSGVKCQKWW